MQLFVESILFFSLILLAIGSVAPPPYSLKHFRLLGWVGFGAYWTLQFPYYWTYSRSFIEGALVISALPLSLFIAYRVYSRETPSLNKASKAIVLMGLIYFPVKLIEPLRMLAIEIVAQQTLWGVKLLGFDVRLVEEPVYGYMGALMFSGFSTPLQTHIELACTGLGSIAMFVGVISLLNKPIHSRLLLGLGGSIGIYALNFIRNVFIASAYGGQWFQWQVSSVMDVTGYSNEELVSFFIADKVISQFLSLIILLSLFYMLLVMNPSLHALYQGIHSELFGDSREK